ncbi:diguanylate cyclase [Ferrimonas balearica]|uniref:diguanylate cyclase n=1 Tax=Ferrimonas balearica TaxID=44012 RepID=UPI001C99836D|nr:diguanylate cyclase [Ferrimonas balearica]MBY5920725.1 diguanylate cyclase [Ferrimonas balearica]MBY5996590.1 diguanylate cyclase [Ferrimonas balearica]
MGKKALAPYRIFAGRLLTSTALGLFGYFINCYPVPLFSNIELVLGNTLILLCASRLGPYYTLWCAALAISGLAQAWGHHYVYLTYGLEALVVCLLRRRGWYLLYADLFYWCFLGMPITALVILQFFTIPVDYQFFTVVKQGFNGFLYTALASLISLLIPSGWFRLIRQQPNVLRTFRQKLVHAVLVMLSLVFIGSMLVASRNLVITQQQLLAFNLNERSAHLVHEYQRYLDFHQRAVLNASQWLLRGVYEDEWQGALEQLHRQYPGYLTMLMTDSTGRITQASPSHLMAGNPVLSVADRNYFKVPMTEGRPYISALLQGRGFGQDPIVAISAPILGEDLQPVGIVEGSLDLTHIANDTNHSHWGEVAMVLTDSESRVIYASEILKLNVFSPFEFLKLKEVEGFDLSLMNIHSTSSSVGEYFYHHTTLANGWRLYVMLPYRPLAERLEAYYMLGIGLLVIGMVLATLLARQIGAYLTSPLEFLVRKLMQRQQSEDPLSRLPALPRGSALEVRTLYDELETNRSALRAYQHSLEELVATRTAQLEAANAKLAQLAHRDGLTGAYNRRYFDQQFETARQHCVRGEGQLGLALIDIDHFKAINDNHGHLVGDDCLKSLVTLIQNHFTRKLDLLARYGGEEFVLLLPHSRPEELIPKLETLRRKVADSPLSFTADGEPLHVTVSIGLFVAEPEFSTVQTDWILAADTALYQAKQGGRNRLCLADSTTQDTETVRSV